MLGENNMKKRFFTYMPEMSWMNYVDASSPVKVTEAPLVVYNPDKLNKIDDPIPPSASVMVVYGEKNWEAVYVYAS
jgi:hypothetical protein